MRTPPSPRRPRSRGFTLIEVMLVIAIIGLVSSIAVPQMQRFANKAKAVEREQMLRSIARTVQERMNEHATNEAYELILPANPPSNPGRFQQNLGTWAKLNFSPEGTLRYRYSGSALMQPDGTGHITLIAMGDVDGNNNESTFQLEVTLQNGAWVEIYAEETDPE
jgi:prepilin-type N-terminal cleavage/methylation domain-containing protein